MPTLLAEPPVTIEIAEQAAVPVVANNWLSGRKNFTRMTDWLQGGSITCQWFMDYGYNDTIDIIREFRYYGTDRPFSMVNNFWDNCATVAGTSAQFTIVNNNPLRIQGVVPSGFGGAFARHDQVIHSQLPQFCFFEKITVFDPNYPTWELQDATGNPLSATLPSGSAIFGILLVRNPKKRALIAQAPTGQWRFADPPIIEVGRVATYAMQITCKFTGF